MYLRDCMHVFNFCIPQKTRKRSLHFDMDRAIYDYLVQGNAIKDEVDNSINACLMFAKGGIKA